MALSGVSRPRAPILPLAPDRYERAWMQRALDMMAAASETTVKTSEAAPFVLLLSPSGKVFKLTVSDAGAVTAAEVLQGGHP